jgi:gliding motility-associated-like protein
MQPPVAGFSYVDTCAGLLARFINTTQLSGDSLTQVFWNFGDSTIDFSRDTALHNYANTGNYILTLKVSDNHGCADSVVQALKILPAINYNYQFTNDSVIYPGKSTTVSVTGNFSAILWNDGSLLSSKTIDDSGYYSFAVSNASGCTESRQLRVSYFNLPTGNITRANDFITPNGDGVNDVLYFKNIENYNTCTVQVFDAQGMEVFNSGAYQNDWDGTMKGKALNAGSYYYIIKCDAFPQLTGVTNIIR